MNIQKKKKRKKLNINCHLEAGSGAGVTLNPVAFLVIQNDCVKLLPIDHSSSIDRLLDYVPDLIEKANNMLNKKE